MILMAGVVIFPAIGDGEFFRGEVGGAVRSGCQCRHGGERRGELSDHLDLLSHALCSVVRYGRLEMLQIAQPSNSQ